MASVTSNDCDCPTIVQAHRPVRTGAAVGHQNGPYQPIKSHPRAAGHLVCLALLSPLFSPKNMHMHVYRRRFIVSILSVLE